MPDGLPHRSCRVFRAFRIRAYQQCADVAFFLRQKRAFLPYQYRRRKYESDKISEKALLYRRQIACQPYESTHKSKAKGGADNAQHAFVLRDILLRIPAILNHLFLLRQTAVVRFRAVLSLRPMRKARGGRTCILSELTAFVISSFVSPDLSITNMSETLLLLKRSIDEMFVSFSTKACLSYGIRQWRTVCCLFYTYRCL